MQVRRSLSASKMLMNFLLYRGEEILTSFRQKRLLISCEYMVWWRSYIARSDGCKHTSGIVDLYSADRDKMIRFGVVESKNLWFFCLWDPIAMSFHNFDNGQDPCTSIMAAMHCVRSALQLPSNLPFNLFKSCKTKKVFKQVPTCCAWLSCSIRLSGSLQSRRWLLMLWTFSRNSALSPDTLQIVSDKWLQKA